MRTLLWLAAALAVSSSASANRGARGRPLADKNVLWVLDLHRSNDAATRGLRVAGIRPYATIAVGQGSYGGSTAGSTALVAQGFDVRLPFAQRSTEVVERALDDLVMMHKQNGRRIVVVEQGGLVARLLRGKKFDGVRDAFQFVYPPGEPQRSQGRVTLSGRSHAIGTAVAQRAVDALARRARAPRVMRALVLGNTPVGQASALKLVQMGVDVAVVDPAATPAQRQAAQRSGLRLMTGRSLQQADVIVDATGAGLGRGELPVPRGAAFISAADVADATIPGERGMRRVRELIRQSVLEDATR